VGGSPTIDTVFAQRLVIGVGDMAVSNKPGVILSTYALGSCIGVVVFDPAAHVGGILHVMLPESSLSPAKAQANPCMFADAGMPHFFRNLQGAGANIRRCNLMLAGGAAVLSGSDVFKIGDRNLAAVRAILDRSGISIRHQQTGGISNRTVHLTLSTGTVELKLPSGTTTYPLA